MKKVSIIMLTYNRAAFLKESIAGILKQTYMNFELIIIDDGSTDETVHTMKTYDDARIRYIRHEENEGLLTRRKESLTLATGHYVAVCDSDDLWLPSKLEKQIAYMDMHPDCVLIGTWIKRIDDTGAALGELRYETSDTAIRHEFLWRNQFAHSSVLMRKDALNKTQGYRFPLDEDLDLFLQLGQYGALANIPEALICYRIHADGASFDRLGMIKNVLAIIKLHRTDYPGYRLAKAKYSLAYIFSYLKKSFSLRATI